MLDPASIAAGGIIFGAAGFFIGGLMRSGAIREATEERDTATSQLEDAKVRIACLLAENMAWARKEAKRLRQCREAGKKGRATQKAMREDERVIMDKCHAQMRETLEMVGG